MKYTKKFKRAVCMILCLCMMMGTVLTLASCKKEEEPVDPNANKVKVVRVIKTVEAGTQIKGTALEEVMIDRDQVPKGAFSSTADIINKFALVNLYSGDVIFEEKISKIAPISYWGEEAHEDYVIVTEYIKPGETDMSASIQRAVDDNPNKTIYFPDGNYILSKPIKTSADPDKCVSFRLSNYAYVAANAGNWDKNGEAVFELGSSDNSQDGNYYLVGGIISGSGITAAVSVQGGTAYINNFSLKQTTTGIIVKENAKADIDSGVISGKGAKAEDYEGATGILVEGDKCTLTNVRLSSIDIGVKVSGSDNVLRNVHPLYVGTVHDESVAFWDTGSGNFYDMCYSDQFAIAYRMSGDTYSVYNACLAYWYTSGPSRFETIKDENDQDVRVEKPYRQYGFYSDGMFNSVIRNSQVSMYFGSDRTQNHNRENDVDTTFVRITDDGGTGAIIYPVIAKPEYDDYRAQYEKYVKLSILD